MISWRYLTSFGQSDDANQSQGQSRVGNPKPSKHSVPHKSTLRYYFQSSPSPRVQQSLAVAAGVAEPWRIGGRSGCPFRFWQNSKQNPVPFKIHFYYVHGV